LEGQSVTLCFCGQDSKWVVAKEALYEICLYKNVSNESLKQLSYIHYSFITNIVYVSTITILSCVHVLSSPV